jgi:hypothetical protein
VPASARRPLSIALVGTASAALLLGSAASAQAAAPKLKTVSMDQAFAALPTAKTVPGDVRLTAKFETPGSAAFDPCPQTDLAALIAELSGDSSGGAPGLSFAGTQVGAVYEPAHSKTPTAKTATWQLNAVVFHTAKLAKAAAAKLAATEKSCPKTTPPIPGLTLPFSLLRTKSAVYSVDGWTGYRTVDQMSTLNLLLGPDPVGTRSTQVYLTRGNVMLVIDETGTIEPGTAPRQEVWRQQVTRGMLTSFDALVS